MANKNPKNLKEQYRQEFREEIKGVIDSLKKDEKCTMLEDLGYHIKECWDECWGDKNYNQALDDIIQKIDNLGKWK